MCSSFLKNSINFHLQIKFEIWFQWMRSISWHKLIRWSSLILNNIIQSTLKFFVYKLFWFEFRSFESIWILQSKLIFDWFDTLQARSRSYIHAFDRMILSFSYGSRRMLSYHGWYVITSCFSYCWSQLEHTDRLLLIPFQ